MVASTTSPLSHLTRNIAFGSASWTTPSNSSLSPLGSFRSRLSAKKRAVSFFLRLLEVPERFDDARGDLVHAPHSRDAPQDAEALVVGEELCRHRLVRTDAIPDDLLVVVCPVL